MGSVLKSWVYVTFSQSAQLSTMLFCDATVDDEYMSLCPIFVGCVSSDSQLQASFLEGTHVPTQPHPGGYACVCGRPQSYKDWHQSQLVQACSAVMGDALSIRTAAELFSVPRSTLHDRITGRVSQGSSSSPPKYLSTEEEEELV